MRLRAGTRVVLGAAYGTIINPGVKKIGAPVLSIQGAATNPTVVRLGGDRPLRAGDVLSLAPTGKLPDGLFDRVLSVVHQHGSTVLTVKPTSVFSVIPVADYDVPFTIAPAGTSGAGRLRRALSPPTCGASLSRSQPGVYRSVHHIRGHVSWNTLPYTHVPVGLKVGVDFDVAAGIDDSMAVTIGAQCQLSVPYQAMAGPVPITGNIYGKLYASLVAGVSLTAGVGVHVHAGAGTIGIPTPLLIAVPDVRFSNPSTSVSSGGQISVTAGFGVGATVGVGSQVLAVDAELDFDNDYNFTAQAALGSGSGFTCMTQGKFASFSIQGQLGPWKLHSPSTPPLFTRTIWGPRPCEGSPGGGPGGGAPVNGTLAVGYTHTCALLSSGGVDCWGDNSVGELGMGTETGPQSCGSFYFCSTTPVAVWGITNAVQVAAGWDATCARLSTGQIDCWGNVAGSVTNNDLPVPISGINSASDVAVGRGLACAVLRSGQVDCWGDNSLGELGDGTMTTSVAPVAVSGITNATAVAAGGQFACALLATGAVDCWGDNMVGQLGADDGSGPDQCGAPVFACSMTPVAVASTSDATAVAAGEDHACALLADRSMECWGDDQDGQLGNGTTNTTGQQCGGGSACFPAPVAVNGLSGGDAIAGGTYAGCAALASGLVNCWGDNFEGQLGDGSAEIFSDVPVTVKSITNAAAVGAGDYYACALLSTTAVDCWGDNSYGQLGDGSTTWSNVPVAVTGLP